MRYDCYEMARPRRYETQALKQKAYRLRKKNLSVSATTDLRPSNQGEAGEVARLPLQKSSVYQAENSNGGQNNLGRTPVERFESVDGSTPSSPTQKSSKEALLPFRTKKVGEFRMLVLPEQPKEEATIPVVKPLVFRDDNGRVISERAWNALQKLKEKAKGRYEIDDYIQ